MNQRIVRAYVLYTNITALTALFEFEVRFVLVRWLSAALFKPLASLNDLRIRGKKCEEF